jgi:signal transduction histidine kinase
MTLKTTFSLGIVGPTLVGFVALLGIMRWSLQDQARRQVEAARGEAEEAAIGELRSKVDVAFSMLERCAEARSAMPRAAAQAFQRLTAAQAAKADVAEAIARGDLCRRVEVASAIGWGMPSPRWPVSFGSS